MPLYFNSPPIPLQNPIAATTIDQSLQSATTGKASGFIKHGQLKPIQSNKLSLTPFGVHLSHLKNTNHGTCHAIRARNISAQLSRIFLSTDVSKSYNGLICCSGTLRTKPVSLRELKLAEVTRSILFIIFRKCYYKPLLHKQSLLKDQ